MLQKRFKSTFISLRAQILTEDTYNKKLNLIFLTESVFSLHRTHKQEYVYTIYYDVFIFGQQEETGKLRIGMKRFMRFSHVVTAIGEYEAIRNERNTSN
jgi:hypothetical protein